MKEKIVIQLKNDDSELMKFLTMEEIPFEVPKFFEFPSGKKNVSDRAKRLMEAGIDYMKEKHPKKATQNQMKIESW